MPTQRVRGKQLWGMLAAGDISCDIALAADEKFGQRTKKDEN
jgi:hypothetical protein